MGKTSLLRQLEALTTPTDSAYVPLYWDLQGSETPAHLSEELFFAIDDARDRLRPFGLDVDALEGQDALTILRKVQKCVFDHDRRLLLLIDEAEALIRVGQYDIHWLARLRKAFQSDRQRTVMTATKLLSKLNELSSEWMTSPFLFGFNLVNLWRLEPEDGEALVQQTQSDTPVAADPAIVEQVLDYANGHPYLVQYLCQRLFYVDGGFGRLRAIVDADLVPDQLLIGFFSIDFQHLTQLERRILLAIAEQRAPSERDLFSALSDEPPSRLRTFLYGLHKLGYIRTLDDKWTVGNEYFRRWMRSNLDSLVAEVSPTVNDRRVEELLERGAGQEHIFLQTEMAELQSRLSRLQAMQNSSSVMAPLDLQNEILRVSRALERSQHDLRFLTETVAQRI